MQRSVSAPIHAARGRRWGIAVWSLLLYVVLTIGATATLLPFLWTILTAFKPASEILTYPPVWITANPTLANLERVWSQINFARYFTNSLLIATTVTCIVLLTSSFVGYVLAKFSFRGRDAFFLALLATMMIPWPVTFLPTYQIAVWLGLINTYAALIVPALYSPFGIFLMRQYMMTIPGELLDAARIDGASEPRIFYQVVLPLTGPALAALGILQFIGNWDAFLWPLLVLNHEDMYTLPLGLASFVTLQYTDYAPLMAGAVVSIVPLFILYAVLQRYFIAGIALTGLKG